MNSSSLEESPGTKTLFQSVFPGPVLTRFVYIFSVNCEENKSRLIPIVKAKTVLSWHEFAVCEERKQGFQNSIIYILW